MAFHGTFEHTLDAKNRLIVPAKFRAALSGNVFLVKGTETCFSIYPGQEYEQQIEQALSGLNRFSPEGRELRRLYYGGAMETALDAAGRIMVPPVYLKHAEIAGRDVVITGTGDALEIWDRDRWTNYEPGLRERGPELTSKLGHPG